MTSTEWQGQMDWPLDPDWRCEVCGNRPLLLPTKRFHKITLSVSSLIGACCCQFSTSRHPIVYIVTNAKQRKEKTVNNQEFLFLFDAVLRNASDRPHRQWRFLYQALRHGHISLTMARTLQEKYNVRCASDSLTKAAHAYFLSMSDPDDQLDRQQMADLEPPGEFEQDPMNPCGALDPRF